VPDVSVVIPVRNAERLLEACLASITRNEPREIIVVDGMSTDGTLDIARRYGAKILSDEGGGLPAARLLGAEVAASERVALVDADVVMPDGGLAALVEEFEQGGFTALQAGQLSVSGPAYWGQALVNHHRTGRSKNWFGLVATLFDRKALLEHGFDARFLSGEDIELRWRLQRAGARIGVSERTIVEHRFEDDSYDFAKGQWLADGHGLGRMVVKHGARGAPLLGLPLAAAVRGIGLSLLRRQPKWIRYYSYYMVFNYVGMVAELGELWRRRSMTRARLAA
jgi:glycosyltransferase involved in cell wall biosynthesis